MLGVCSLIVWALTLVVTVKYLMFVMRADNQGEGGILALLALVPQNKDVKKHARIGAVAVMVIAGAALLYGDGIITPAISVLSALEGVEVAAPGFKSVVVPLTCVVLLGLFAIQSKGTGGLGKVFGPVMVIWFTTIAGLGAWHIAHNTDVLVALNPYHGALYFSRHGVRGIPILGIVVLAVTGGEALYADMGHFGARPIRLAWLALVFPALVLCYLGQGALVLRDAHAVDEPVLRDGPHRHRHVRSRRALDRGHDHRVAVAHHGRLLADPPGRCAGSVPARDRDPYVPGHRGADLRARDELGSLHRCASAWSCRSGSPRGSPRRTGSP